ncbi:hypothetical protein D9758_004151 [Tetrapyrgos nigripes]|uniref:Nop14-like protein n=1 Tax=Tetrapyrgos nigripes TaxID=182062 RepID=A0A8H5LVS0_9AGAR|nr:hypothetical protein D9758_004151 [Tetrapyrgos nigripes]
MGKGSQLSQLKSSLSQAGITGNGSNSKKRKRTAPQEKKDKEKRTAKLEEIHRKLNPFDTKVTKLKHDVGGRKLKGVTGKPAQSKMAGVEQRKKTLLKEWEERGRAGGIVDRRFGENDPSMSLEERMLERFTRERQKASHGSLFNLEDEDELTHYGQSLSKLDDFDNVGLLNDEDDEDEVDGQIDKEIVQRTHFGGFDDDEDEDEDEEPARKKSKAEVMAEVIAKSKEHKLRRQMERDEGENDRLELDDAFDSLRGLLYASAPDPEFLPSTSHPPPVLRISAQGEVSTSTSGPSGLADDSTRSSLPKPAFTEQKLDYDQQVRALAFDARAKPKDRTKTEEEIALEEKEALERAERKRRKRMLGLDDDSEDEDEDEGKGKGKRKRERGGDDLEDDFNDEEIGWTGLGGGLEEMDEEDGSDDDSEDGEDEDDEGESESAEDDSEEEESDQEDLVTKVKGKPLKNKGTASSGTELPFTFPCPSSHDEFLEIVDGIDDNDVPTVVQRIRKLHHPSLRPDNKFKLQGLTEVLIDHILYVTSPPTPRFRLVSALVAHLNALCRSYPIQGAQHFVQKLTIMNKNLKRGLSKGPLDPESKTWPSMAELSLLRIVGTIWPTSDMNHPVVSPARVLMGAYLGLGRVRSLKDIASGLFLCTLFLQYEQLSQRFIPEAVNFLVNTILHLGPHGYKSASQLPGSFPSPDFRSDLCLPLSIDVKKARKVKMEKPDLAALLSSDQSNQADKVNLFALALELTNRYAVLCKGLEAFIELFEPISEILQKVEINKLGKDIQDQYRNSSDQITRLLKFARESRRPLMLQSHKPIPIPSYIPKFETTSSSYLRAQDPDRERNEEVKLKREYKKEKKSAIRELRKDARFLAGVEQAKQKEKDRAYSESLKKVFGSIEGERAEQKAMEREKMKEKKRAGRK